MRSSASTNCSRETEVRTAEGPGAPSLNVGLCTDLILNRGTAGLPGCGRCQACACQLPRQPARLSAFTERLLGPAGGQLPVSKIMTMLWLPAKDIVLHSSCKGPHKETKRPHLPDLVLTTEDNSKRECLQLTAHARMPIDSVTHDDPDLKLHHF